MLSIIRQTDQNIAVNFTENGEPVDISDTTILFTVKRQCDINKNDDFALIKKTITEHIDAEGGKSNIELSNEDTNIEAGNYYWDLRLIENGSIVQTKRDNLEITQGITNRKLTI
jgi:hypothetical protein